MRFTHQEVGYNYRLTNIQAAVGVAQMEHFDEAVEAKIEIARNYTAALSGVDGLTLPPEARWGKNVFWVYGIVVEKEFGLRRSVVQRLLRHAGIETRRFFTPIHRQPIFRDATDGDYPTSVHLGENGLYLPSYIGMTKDTIVRIANAIRNCQSQRACIDVS